MAWRNSIITILTAMLLSGCWGTLLGAAAGGAGSYVAKREYNKSKIKQETAAQKRRDREYLQARTEWEKERARAQTTDDRLKATLSQTYVGGGLTRVLAVNPEIKNGVVTLYGNVPNVAVADRAVEIARKTRGVREVISKLTIVEMDIKPVEGRAGVLYAPNQRQAATQASRKQAPPQQNYARQFPVNMAPTPPATRPTASIEELRKVLNDPNYKPSAPVPARRTINRSVQPPRGAIKQLPPTTRVATPVSPNQQDIYNTQQPPIYPHVMKQQPPPPRKAARKDNSFRPELIMPHEAAPRPPKRSGSRAHWAPTRPENIPRELRGLTPADDDDARQALKEREESIQTRSFWDNFGNFLGMGDDTGE